MEEGKGVNFILGMLVGTLVGASIAILLAPQSGIQTREQIKEKADELRKKAENGHDFKEDAEEWIEKGHSYVGDKVETIKGAIKKKKQGEEPEEVAKEDAEEKE